MNPLLFCLRGDRSARPDRRAWAALIISRVFLMKGNVGLSHAYLRLSAALFKASDRDALPSGLFVNRALILKARGRVREAAALLRAVVDRSLRRGETLAAAKAAANLALCIARGGAADGAEPYLGLAERSYRALGCDDGLIRLDLTRGLVDARQGAFDEGIERIVQTIGRCGENRYARERIIGQMLLAELFLSKNDIDRAREALDAVVIEEEPLRRFGPQRVRRFRLECEWSRRVGDSAASSQFMRMAEDARIGLGLGPVEVTPFEPAAGAAPVAREVAYGRPSTRVRTRGDPDEAFITVDARTIALLDEVARAAQLPVPILITGESGVGKELVARSIHRWSGREREPFIPVNVAALPMELFESIVFGHERGAFTGAIARMPGLLESAGRGTLFLDEIGELAPVLQAKLLRLVDRGEYVPVGGGRQRTSPARIVAATNRDLDAECASSRFRTDLYYRLAAFVARIPPLRERREDIPALAHRLLERACERHGLGVKALGGGTLDLLARYDWPGNVRELEGEILGAALRARGAVVRIGHFSPRLIMKASAGRPAPACDLRAKVAALERSEILEALRASGGSCAGAACFLGLRRTTLIGKMKRLGIER